MPSSKAILADITNLGLNPCKAYSQTNSAGQLCDNEQPMQVSVQHKAEKINTQNALKQIAKEAVIVDDIVEQTQTDITINAVEEISDVPVFKPETQNDKFKKSNKKKKNDEV